MVGYIKIWEMGPGLTNKSYRGKCTGGMSENNSQIAVFILTKGLSYGRLREKIRRFLMEKEFDDVPLPIWLRILARSIAMCLVALVAVGVCLTIKEIYLAFLI